MMLNNTINSGQELSSSQQYIVDFAEGLVREFLSGLGVHRRKLSPNSVAFSPKSSISQYRQETNTIILSNSDEFSLSVLVHELIHFFSASQQLLSEKEFEEYTHLPAACIAKSGFHSVWTSHESGE